MTTNTMCAQCHTTINPEDFGSRGDGPALQCERHGIPYCDKRCYYRKAVECADNVNLALPTSFALAMIADCTDDQLECLDINDNNPSVTIRLRNEDIEFALGILANSNA